MAEVGETSSTPEAPSAAPTAAEQASPQVKHVAVEATVVAAQEQVCFLSMATDHIVPLAGIMSMSHADPILWFKDLY